MRKKIIMLAFIICFVTVSSAMAQEGWKSYVPTGYFGIFGGFSMPDDLEFDEGPISEIGLDNGWVLGARLGGFFARPLAIEIEYYHMGKMDVDSIGPFEGGEITADNVFVNLLLRYPDSRFHPFVGGGAGWQWIEWKDINTNLGSLKDDDNTWALQFLAGVDIDIAANMSLSVTYRYIYSEPSLAANDAEFKSHVLTAGVNFMF